MQAAPALSEILDAINCLSRVSIEMIEGRSGATDLGLARGVLGLAPGAAALTQPDYLALYKTPTPLGYDTILGFLAREQPEVLDLMSEPISDTVRDGFAMRNISKRAGVFAVKVAAPPGLIAAGITEVNAYSLELLRGRFG